MINIYIAQDGATEDKSIQWQGGGFEPGTTR